VGAARIAALLEPNPQAGPSRFDLRTVKSNYGRCGIVWRLERQIERIGSGFETPAIIGARMGDFSDGLTRENVQLIDREIFEPQRLPAGRRYTAHGARTPRATFDARACVMVAAIAAVSEDIAQGFVASRIADGFYIEGDYLSGSGKAARTKRGLYLSEKYAAESGVLQPIDEEEDSEVV
jgi:hypothetical protein